jgi:uncharacterized protein YndB with AHSA1/START domain
MQQFAGPIAKVQILIRKPAPEVFRAITTPEGLEQFWLSKASGPLTPGATVQWDFMVPGIRDQVTVKEFAPDSNLLVEFSDGTSARWDLISRADGHTKLEVSNWGFKGTPEEIIEQALESTQGFTLVLSDLKVFLEHGRSPNLTRDKARLIQEHLRSQP